MYMDSLFFGQFSPLKKKKTKKTCNNAALKNHFFLMCQPPITKFFLLHSSIKNISLQNLITIIDACL